MIVLLAVVWAYAAAETYSLALRRDRAGVLAGALRSRTALFTGIVLAPVCAALSPAAAAPLLLLPAAAALRVTPGPLGALIRTLLAGPRGPSDPPLRRAAAGPALLVPVTVAAVCAPAALLAASGGATAVIAAYAVALLFTATLAVRPPGRVHVS